MIPQDALIELRPMLGEPLSTGKSDLALPGRSGVYHSEMRTDAVAYPRTTTEISELMRGSGFGRSVKERERLRCAPSLDEPISGYAGPGR